MAASGKVKSNHVLVYGVPAGGTTHGPGFAIGWQNGPMKDRDGNALEQNGAFVQDLLEAVSDRIGFYQSTKFVSVDNQEALQHIAKAQECLDRRMQKREERKVEGTHSV